MGSPHMKDLAIIILDWNGASDTIDCIEALHNYDLYDIYILDNGSERSNIEMLRIFLTNNFLGQVEETCIGRLAKSHKPVTYILSKENLGFAGGNNAIAKRICEDYNYVLLLNNDTIVPQHTIEHMVRTMNHCDYTAITCDIRHYYSKNELWNAGGDFTILGDRKYYSQKKIDGLKKSGTAHIAAPFITGCAFLIRSSYIRNHGLFTDKFFHGEEDFNLCYKLKRDNFKTGVDLQATLYHKVGRALSRAPNHDREYNRILLHYLNRVIDFKDFYGKTRWLLWRDLYLLLIVARRIIDGLSPRNAFLLYKRIRYYSDTNNAVRKDLFDHVMSLTWE